MTCGSLIPEWRLPAPLWSLAQRFQSCNQQQRPLCARPKENSSRRELSKIGLPRNLYRAVTRLLTDGLGASLEDRPRYTPTTTFETFPFPASLTPNIPAEDYASDSRAVAIADAARRLNQLRENWLFSPDPNCVSYPAIAPGARTAAISCPLGCAASGNWRTRRATGVGRSPIGGNLSRRGNLP